LKNISQRVALFLFSFLSFYSTQASEDEKKIGDLIQIRPFIQHAILSEGLKTWVGVRFSLAPKWHVYWENAGDSGYPTTLQWKLPQGWRMGPLLYPAPYLYEHEGMTGYALKNKFSLLAELHAPPFSETKVGKVKITGILDALVCNEASCIPYREEFSLNLLLGKHAEKNFTDDRLVHEAVRNLPIIPPSDTKTNLFHNSHGSFFSIRSPGLSELPSHKFNFYPTHPSIKIKKTVPFWDDQQEALLIACSLTDDSMAEQATITGVLSHPNFEDSWKLKFSSNLVNPPLNSEEFKAVSKIVRDEYFLLHLLLSIVLIAMSAWAYGRSLQPSVRVGIWRIFAICSFSAAIWLGFPKVSDVTTSETRWIPWSPTLQADLLKQGKAVFVDYTAKWCLSCQVNKHVYQNHEFQQLIKERNIHLLRADWTKKSPAILSSLQSYGREGVPLNVYYPPTVEANTEKKAVILPEILSVDLLKKTFESGQSLISSEHNYELLALMGLAWVGGLILNLMPCVFPVIGLKIMAFVKQAGENRSNISKHGWAFTAGVIVSFWILVVILLFLRNTLESDLGWGFQLQEPVFVFVLACLLLMFGLSLSGVFEFGGSMIGIGSGLTALSGFAGSFFSGVLATVVATPCMAPFLGVVVGAALMMPASSCLAIFTVIGLGLSTPYLLLSFFPRWIEKLPRPGGWMESFKQFMAFPIYATVAWLIWTLEGLL